MFIVACDDDEVAAWAGTCGAEVLWTPGLGLNGAIEHSVEVSELVGGLSLGPNARRAAVEARGELFSVPVEDGVVRNLTRARRLVVVPVSATVQPFARAQRWIVLAEHILPWQGPMEIVL